MLTYRLLSKYDDINQLTEHYFYLAAYAPRDEPPAQTAAKLSSYLRCQKLTLNVCHSVRVCGSITRDESEHVRMPSCAKLFFSVELFGQIPVTWFGFRASHELPVDRLYNVYTWAEGVGPNAVAG